MSVTVTAITVITGFGCTSEFRAGRALPAARSESLLRVSSCDSSSSLPSHCLLVSATESFLPSLKRASKSFFFRVLHRPGSLLFRVLSSESADPVPGGTADSGYRDSDGAGPACQNPRQF